MDTVTYPDLTVERFLTQQFIPLRVKVKESPALAQRFLAVWTPNVLVANADAVPEYRVEGYLPPREFVGRMALGLARHLLNSGSFEEAFNRWQEAAERHTETEIGAEALYWLGVAAYKKTHDPSELSRPWQRLMKEQPRSEWALKANVPRKT